VNEFLAQAMISGVVAGIALLGACGVYYKKQSRTK
jgi:hypothetical protein